MTHLVDVPLFDVVPTGLLVFTKEEGVRITNSPVALKGVYFGVAYHPALARPVIKIHDEVTSWYRTFPADIPANHIGLVEFLADLQKMAV